MWVAEQCFEGDEGDDIPAGWWLRGPEYVDAGDSLWFGEGEAKRIAAAVNATAGIHTEALEQGIVQEMVAALTEVSRHIHEEPMSEEHIAQIVMPVLARIRGEEGSDDD